jgi:hypothetical protein
MTSENPVFVGLASLPFLVLILSLLAELPGSTIRIIASQPEQLLALGVADQNRSVTVKGKVTEYVAKIKSLITSNPHGTVEEAPPVKNEL